MDTYNINLPIIIHLNNNISKHEYKNNDTKGLKLFRKKTVKTDIFDKLQSTGL